MKQTPTLRKDAVHTDWLFDMMKPERGAERRSPKKYGLKTGVNAFPEERNS